MGGSISRILAGLWSKKEIRILILGLDNAGKTTLLYRLKIGEVVTTIPTIGFNVESVTYKNLNFNVWDLGGQTSIRPYWRCYYANTAAVIFVIDSTDIERLSTASDELAAMLNEDELREAALLVFANKQDQPGAKGAGEVSEALHLGQLKDRNWSIVACSAVEGKGVDEGMDWLVPTQEDEEEDQNEDEASGGSENYSCWSTTDRITERVSPRASVGAAGHVNQKIARAFAGLSCQQKPYTGASPTYLARPPGTLQTSLIKQLSNRHTETGEQDFMSSPLLTSRCNTRPLRFARLLRDAAAQQTRTARSRLVAVDCIRLGSLYAHQDFGVNDVNALDHRSPKVPDRMKSTSPKRTFVPSVFRTACNCSREIEPVSKGL
ncbi:MAG: hypothetical protein Q9173_000840 [Seirophora scorigena]